MRRAAVAAAWIVLLVGLAIAVVPFRGSVGLPRGSYTYGADHPSLGASRCSAPIIDAFRTGHVKGGWFGYTPLTDSPLTGMTTLATDCQRPARRRLALAASLAAVGGVALVVTRRRRDGTAMLQPV